MKNFKYLALIALLVAHPTWASDYTWQLQITDPSFELQYKNLDDKAYKPFLPKTSWRCEVEPVIKANQREMRTLECDYSIKKTGLVKTVLGCGPQKAYNEVSLELFDEKKNLTFTVMLTCKQKKP